jgi:membrane-bound lytic murein transglycosylase A
MHKISRALIPLFAFFLIYGSGSASADGSYRTGPGFILTKSGFSSLPGWHDDRISDLSDGLKIACERILQRRPEELVGPDGVAGTVEDWTEPCTEILAAVGEERPLRRALERGLVPMQVSDGGQPIEVAAVGEFTVPGSRERTEQFRFPLYKKPKDLVSVRTSDLDPSLPTTLLFGKLESGRLIPYPTRGEIMQGALEGKTLELVWLADPVTAFEVEQRRGALIQLAEGGSMRVLVTGNNGRSALHLGKLLFSDKYKAVKFRGRKPQPDTTIGAAIGWLRENPEAAPGILAQNERISFFRETTGPVPFSTWGFPLISGRSASVDSRFLPVGMPIWVDLADRSGGAMRRLLLSQETGGQAFRARKVELYTADRPMEAKGSAWLLLPEAAVARLEPVRPVSVETSGAGSHRTR